MSDTHDLRQQLERIASLDGEGTELVSVAVPPDQSIDSVRKRIRRERADAENIKSDRTRDRVQRALDRVARILRGYPATPENGLVVYAGVVDGDLVSAVFDDLPAPVPESTYRCDGEFAVDPVRAAATPGETFGLVAVQRGEATVGRLVGERVVVDHALVSQVMGSSRAGGQSARRFERERQRQANEFYRQVGRAADETFLGEDPVAGVAVGGTLTTAKAFVDGDYLDHRLRDRIVGTYAVEYAGRQGLRQVVDAAEDELLDGDARAARERLDEFFERLRDGDRVAYGREELDRAVEYGAVDVALVAASVPRDRRDELEAAVTGQGGDLHVVPTGTDRGARFADAFDGVGALLRFPIA